LAKCYSFTLCTQQAVSHISTMFRHLFTNPFSWGEHVFTKPRPSRTGLCAGKVCLPSGRPCRYLRLALERPNRASSRPPHSASQRVSVSVSRALRRTTDPDCPCSRRLFFPLQCFTLFSFIKTTGSRGYHTPVATGERYLRRVAAPTPIVIGLTLRTQGQSGCRPTPGGTGHFS
jgi:hypothetical protein